MHEYHIAVIKETCITLACFEDAAKLRQPEPPSFVALQTVTWLLSKFATGLLFSSVKATKQVQANMSSGDNKVIFEGEPKHRER